MDIVSDPCFIYHIPMTTGVYLSSKEFAKMTRIGNIAGLKYTESNLYELQKLLQETEGKWIAFSGMDQLFLPALTMGVVGCIGTTQNVIPDVFIQIYNHFARECCVPRHWLLF